jgi:hypothetical protein
LIGHAAIFIAVVVFVGLTSANTDAQLLGKMAPEIRADAERIRVPFTPLQLVWLAVPAVLAAGLLESTLEPYYGLGVLVVGLTLWSSHRRNTRRRLYEWLVATRTPLPPPIPVAWGESVRFAMRPGSVGILRGALVFFGFGVIAGSWWLISDLVAGLPLSDIWWHVALHLIDLGTLALFVVTGAAQSSRAALWSDRVEFEPAIGRRRVVYWHEVAEIRRVTHDGFVVHVTGLHLINSTGREVAVLYDSLLRFAELESTVRSLARGAAVDVSRATAFA